MFRTLVFVLVPQTQF